MLRIHSLSMFYRQAIQIEPLLYLSNVYWLACFLHLKLYIKKWTKTVMIPDN